METIGGPGPELKAVSLKLGMSLKPRYLGPKYMLFGYMDP